MERSNFSKIEKLEVKLKAGKEGDFSTPIPAFLYLKADIQSYVLFNETVTQVIIEALILIHQYS